MKLKLFLAGLFFLVFTATTYAQTATPGVKNRQEKQHKRIRHGVHNGEITAGERVVIAEQQQDVRQAKRRAKADGQVTQGERARIHQEQNQASRSIHRKKHNGRDRN
ncbi:MAG: hypothetical protein IPH16_13515 [Haliscomenobacter sp.]|nr:hypothetical protein [Haliscomenobacter sp.]MBK7477339.1 hypothetical protein [Haliscomenobacter sp.]MBK8880069.1 hypothetical protein [Haliscomenobacter sp.]